VTLGLAGPPLIMNEFCFMFAAMLKVPSSQIDVKHDTALEMPHQGPSERRQRPSSVSSKFSLRPPDVDLEQFQPLAFFCLKRESKPRIWFIKLMSWPYPLINELKTKFIPNG
jgi:hypothetical protein